LSSRKEAGLDGGLFDGVFPVLAFGDAEGAGLGMIRIPLEILA